MDCAQLNTENGEHMKWRVNIDFYLAAITCWLFHLSKVGPNIEKNHGSRQYFCDVSMGVLQINSNASQYVYRTNYSNISFFIISITYFKTRVSNVSYLH